MKIHGLIGLIVLLAVEPVIAAPEVLSLYDGAAPGSESWSIKESVVVREDGTHIFYNVAAPELQVYLPKKNVANGAAAIILPGGALRKLSLGDDNQAMIQQLNAQGLAVAVLKYRVLQHQPETGTPAAPNANRKFPKLTIENANANPAPDDADLNQVIKFAVDDTVKAFSILRQKASEWNIDQDRIGLIGTSAGGGIALATYLRGDEEAQPAFIMSNYGPSLLDVHVSPKAPPLFITTETYHGPVTDGLLQLAQMWRDGERPVELHMYNRPNFEMPASLWLPRFLVWLEEQGILTSDAQSRVESVPQ